VLFILHTRLRAHRAPGIPAPSEFQGQDLTAKLAWMRGEIAELRRRTTLLFEN